MSDLRMRPKLAVTEDLKHQNDYTLAIQNEYQGHVFDGEDSFQQKGKWHEVLSLKPEHPIDLEIGTGNGLHFAYRAIENPERAIVGIEMKYKPLVQSIRRALNGGAQNARMVRIHAFNVDEVFASGEISDVFIHFPDPWVSPRKPRNRLVNPRILSILWNQQRPGSLLEFKTDNREYFDWALEHIKNSPYKTEQLSFDLHGDYPGQAKLVTGFERIFMQKGIPINYIRMRRN